MDRMSGSPFAWLKFDKDGRLVDPLAADAVAKLVAADGVSDLVVISHGWKNNENDARTLYNMLWANVVAALRTRKASQIVLAGVEWPAKEYPTDFDEAALRVEGGQGGTRADPPPGARRRDLTEKELDDVVTAFASYVGEEGAAVVISARQAVAGGGLETEGARALFEAALSLMRAGREPDTELRQDLRPLHAGDAHVRLLALAKPPSLKVQPGLGAAQGLGDVLKDVLAGPRAAVARFLNQLTYFEMKTRAGEVGRRLGSKVLPSLHVPGGVRLHLVGHSFGARLVTAAASAAPVDVSLFSLTLLQGAFSHNAMAKLVEPGLPGAFADVVGKPSGPVVMTHTHNDRACTFWYAIASRLSRDISKDIGDKDDMFGAMGANGAQKLATDALAPDVKNEDFRPVAGKVNRFLADSYVKANGTLDAHNNVTNPTVGRLVASVLDTPAR